MQLLFPLGTNRKWISLCLPLKLYCHQANCKYLLNSSKSGFGHNLAHHLFMISQRNNGQVIRLQYKRPGLPPVERSNEICARATEDTRRIYGFGLSVQIRAMITVGNELRDNWGVDMETGAPHEPQALRTTSGTTHYAVWPPVLSYSMLELHLKYLDTSIGVTLIMYSIEHTPRVITIHCNELIDTPQLDAREPSARRRVPLAADDRSAMMICLAMMRLFVIGGWSWCCVGILVADAGSVL